MLLSECVGPVQPAETQALVACLNDMAHRAFEHGQQTLCLVLSMASDSLVDNLETAAEMDDDSDAG